VAQAAGTRDPADEDRWAAYLIDDEPPELAFNCPDCATREFGDG
jgi:hypothetical protein